MKVFRGTRYILRKRPSGVIISPVAHQVDREFRVLEALGKVDFPVPKVYCLCEDNGVIGTSFYVRLQIHHAKIDLLTNDCGLDYGIRKRKNID